MVLIKSWWEQYFTVDVFVFQLNFEFMFDINLRIEMNYVLNSCLINCSANVVRTPNYDDFGVGDVFVDIL